MSEPRKKKHGCLILILAGLAVFLAVPLLWLAFNAGPLASDGNPLAKVSTETTRLTEPLNSNGDVDYLEALNQRQSESITPENNAAVIYTRAFGPCSLDEKLFEQYLTKLGIDGSQVCDNPLLDFDEWYQSKKRNQEIEETVDSKPANDPLEQYRYLMDDAEPFTAEQFPFIVQWMEEYAEVAQTIRNATKRERCYFPLVARSKPQVISALLPHPQKMRHAARYFSMSALRNLHANNIDNFVEDLRCMDRISQHVAHGPTLVEELVAIAIKRMMLHRIVAACDFELGASELKTILAFTETIEPLDDMVSRIDTCERFMSLDAVVSMARGESDMGFTYPQAFVDWNETLRVLNDEFDLLIEKLSVEDPVRRAAGSKEMWDRLEEMEKETSVEFVTSAIMGRKSKGKWMGKLVTTFLFPAFDQVLQAETKLKSEIEMTRIAVAVSVYRKQKGKLPETTQQLVPNYLESIPIEDATGKPYEMSKADTGAGFRIQSATWVEDAEEAGHEVMIAPSSISFEEFLQEY